MSIPSCIRPQRIPKPLTTGPFTGQMRPAADGVVSPGGAYEPADDWILAASAALACARPAASCRYSRLLSLIWSRLSRLLLRAAASWCSFERSVFRTARTCFVRTEIVCVSAATTALNRFVRSRCAFARTLAVPTCSAIRLSCRPMSSTYSASEIMSVKLFAVRTASSVLGSPPS